MNTGGTPSSYLLNANNSNNKNNSNYLTSLINQEPPVLHKFLLKLTEELTDDSTELNQLVKMPFPTITTVSIRTIKTIKIYALIALCTRHNLKNVNYNMFLNFSYLLRLILVVFNNQQQDLQTINRHKHQNEIIISNLDCLILQHSQ